MIGGTPNYILQAAHRMLRGAESDATKSPQKPQAVAAGKTPAATHLVLKSNLRDAKAAPTSLATPLRGSQPAAILSQGKRLSPDQRMAIASAVQTAMERLFSSSSDSAKASAINDMLHEIEGAL